MAQEGRDEKGKVVISNIITSKKSKSVYSNYRIKEKNGVFIAQRWNGLWWAAIRYTGFDIKKDNPMNVGTTFYNSNIEWGSLLEAKQCLMHFAKEHQAKISNEIIHSI